MLNSEVFPAGDSHKVNLGRASTKKKVDTLLLAGSTSTTSSPSNIVSMSESLGLSG